jgi:hypothetical protein
MKFKYQMSRGGRDISENNEAGWWGGEGFTLCRVVELTYSSELNAGHLFFFF